MRRGPKRFWFLVESVPGLEMKKAMNSGSKRRRLYMEMTIFNLAPELLKFNN